jgi:hypothetical protein
MEVKMAEEIHQIGLQGVMRAKQLLWKLLGDGIDLPFNAYDHPSKLAFRDNDKWGVATFNFDLRGNMRRINIDRFGGKETIEVFVEVKSYQYGDKLMQYYSEFLQRAAIASINEEHRDTWFIFLTNVPFGTSKGVELCNGKFLSQCSAKWPDILKPYAAGLESRICIVIANESFQRLLNIWSSYDKRS